MLYAYSVFCLPQLMAPPPPPPPTPPHPHTTHHPPPPPPPPPPLHCKHNLSQPYQIIACWASHQLITFYVTA